MPLPTSITLPSRKEPAEVRRAIDPDTDMPAPYAFETRAAEGKQWLQGKMTFIGIALNFAGVLGQMFGIDLPADEARSVLDWLLASWDSLAIGAGLIIALYGRSRQMWR